MITRSCAGAACALMLISAGARAQTPGAYFRALDLLEGSTARHAVGEAVSDDGKVIVGLAVLGTAGHPVRWDPSGRITVLAATTIHGRATGVTPDGRSIVGRSYRGDLVWSATIWRDGLPEYLPSLPDASNIYATGISTDGRTVSGDMSQPSTYPYSGFVRWVDGKIQDMTWLPGDALTSISDGISGDGRYVVGGGWGAAGGRAIRADTRVNDLGDLPGATGRVEGPGAQSANHDGSRIVGIAPSVTVSVGLEAFLWTPVTGMIGLGAVPARRPFSSAWAISNDGRIVGGRSGYRIPYEDQAFLWDAVHGIRSLNDIVDAHGLDRDGWFIEAVNGLDSTGTAMTGVIRKNGEQRAFLVTLPPWCHADCDGSGDIDFNDFLCFLNRYNRAQADPRAHPVDFVYCDFALDDAIDFADVLEFMRLYSAGCGR